MREQIQARLEALQSELEKGHAELQKVEMQRKYLHETVLRIDGARQVLEELLLEGQPAGQNEPVPSVTQPAAGQSTGRGLVAES
jgi:predicted nuclease with TOPRIM domain